MEPCSTIPAEVSARTRLSAAQKIPGRILQTFATDCVPAGMHGAAYSWIDLNPDYCYRFFDDERCRDFLSSHFDARVLSAFDRVQVGAFKADLWRYCALYVSGGVYADLDTVCTTPLGRLIGDDEFISVFAGAVRGGIFNAFICSVPGHPFLERAIGKSVMNIERGGAGCRHVLEITGPLCLGDAINELVGRPPGAEFLAQRYELGGFRFRILEKVRSDVPSERKVVNGDDTVLMCKYPGYDEDLARAGNRHWSANDGS